MKGDVEGQTGESRLANPTSVVCLQSGGVLVGDTGTRRLSRLDCVGACYSSEPHTHMHSHTHTHTYTHTHKHVGTHVDRYALQPEHQDSSPVCARTGAPIFKLTHLAMADTEAHGLWSYMIEVRTLCVCESVCACVCVRCVARTSMQVRHLWSHVREVWFSPPLCMGVCACPMHAHRIPTHLTVS